MNGTIKTNSFKAWILAARPQTLSGAAVPVVVAITMAIADYKIAATAGTASYYSILSLIISLCNLIILLDWAFYTTFSGVMIKESTERMYIE